MRHIIFSAILLMSMPAMAQNAKVVNERNTAACETAKTCCGSSDREMKGSMEVTVAPVEQHKASRRAENGAGAVLQKPLTVAEKMPSFKGNLNKWMAEHLEYPAAPLEAGVQGRVVVGFVIGKDGSVSKSKIVRGVDPSLDRAALDLVNSMPKWNPGMNNGQPVDVYYTLPVTFRLTVNTEAAPAKK